MADKIRAALADVDLRHADSPTGRVTVSMGLYVGRPALAEHDDPLAWVEAADRLLYEAKAPGATASSRANTLPRRERARASPRPRQAYTGNGGITGARPG